MKVKYIGTNDKTDSINGVGLSWKPGQTHDVTSEVAERLCFYKDTWVKVGEQDLNEPMGFEHLDGKPENPLKMPAALEPDKDAVKKALHAEPIGLKPDEKAVEEPLPVMDFHSMNKKSMIEWADTKLGIKIDKNLSETNVRYRVTDAYAQHNLDEEAGNR